MLQALLWAVCARDRAAGLVQLYLVGLVQLYLAALVQLYLVGLVLFCLLGLESYYAWWD